MYTGNGDDHYWREISARWDGSDDLMFIEHDTEIHDRVVPEFTECGEPWCVFAYEYGPTWPGHLIDNALGCTKFSAALQNEWPAERIAAEVSAMDGMPPVPFWHSCDLYIRRALTRGGYEPHQHRPLVTHHRGRPAV